LTVDDGGVGALEADGNALGDMDLGEVEVATSEGRIERDVLLWKESAIDSGAAYLGSCRKSEREGQEAEERGKHESHWEDPRLRFGGCYRRRSPAVKAGLAWGREGSENGRERCADDDSLSIWVQDSPILFAVAGQEIEGYNDLVLHWRAAP
jgi:hypothetical protein